MASRATLALLSVGGALAAGRCDPDSACSYSISYKGSTYKYDFRSLCNNDADYTVQDDVGHQYYAQICGVTQKPCLPLDFDTYYQYGSMIQTWGSVPKCNLSSPLASCTDKETGLDACCTESCQVVALPETVSKPAVSLINADDISAGIQVSMVGEQPTAKDPNSCSTYDPATGQPVLRHTNMVFQCDASVKGFAQIVSAKQDEKNDCLYTITFKTAVACQYANGLLGLSGGWDFMISLLVLSSLYLLCGTAWNFYRNKTIGLPNAAFWGDVNDLVADGLLFVASGFRKPGRSARKGGLASMGKSTQDLAPLFSASFTGGASASNGSGGGEDVGSKAVAFGEL